MSKRLLKFALGWRVDSLYPLWPRSGSFLGLTFTPVSASIGYKPFCVLCVCNFCAQCVALTVAVWKLVERFYLVGNYDVVVRICHSLATLLQASFWLVIPFIHCPIQQITAVHAACCCVCAGMTLKALLEEDSLLALSARTFVYFLFGVSGQVALFRQCSVTYTLLLFLGLLVRTVLLLWRGRQQVANDGSLVPVALSSLCMAIGCAWLAWKRKSLTTVEGDAKTDSDMVSAIGAPASRIMHEILPSCFALSQDESRRTIEDLYGSSCACQVDEDMQSRNAASQSSVNHVETVPLALVRGPLPINLGAMLPCTIPVGLNDDERGLGTVRVEGSAAGTTLPGMVEDDATTCFSDWTTESKCGSLEVSICALSNQIVQTNLTWNGTILICRACARPPISNVSFDGRWHMCPVPRLQRNASAWMQIVTISGLQFLDAFGKVDDLEKRGEELHLAGGRLSMLANGMLQRESRSSGVTQTFIKVAREVQQVPLEVMQIGELHSDVDELKFGSNGAVSGFRDIATQTCMATYCFCTCQKYNVFDYFDGFWKLANMKQPPKQWRSLRISGTTIVDGIGRRRYAYILDRTSLMFRDGELHRQFTDLVFTGPGKSFCFKRVVASSWDSSSAEISTEHENLAFESDEESIEDDAHVRVFSIENLTEEELWTLPFDNFSEEDDPFSVHIPFDNSSEEYEPFPRTSRE